MRKRTTDLDQTVKDLDLTPITSVFRATFIVFLDIDWLAPLQSKRGCSKNCAALFLRKAGTGCLNGFSNNALTRRSSSIGLPLDKDKFGVESIVVYIFFPTTNFVGTFKLLNLLNKQFKYQNLLLPAVLLWHRDQFV